MSIDEVRQCVSLCKGLGFLGDATQVSTRGVGLGMCPHACGSLSVDGHAGGLAGAIPRESAARLSPTLATAGRGLSSLTAGGGRPLPERSEARGKAPGAATSHAPGPAGHIGQRARAGVWDFWLFFRALPATLSLRGTALCAPRRLGVGVMI